MSLSTAPPSALGAAIERIDGHAKVTGTARYAFEHELARPLYAHAVQASIALGRISSIDTTVAQACPGVRFVLTFHNAPRLAQADDRELWVLQSDEVAFSGQFIGLVVAESLETAREAAGLVKVEYQRRRHDVELRADQDALYAPAHVNPTLETDTSLGDPDAALAAAPVKIDHTYRTPAHYHCPIEPHTTVAHWTRPDGRDHLTLYDSTQGVHRIRETLAPLLGLEPDQVDVVSPYVGGAFGSKARPKAHHTLAALAARCGAGRPVKLALTRQQMLSCAGYRSPTVQRIQLGADTDGRLTAITHDAIGQTSRITEFAEQTAYATRTMYTAPHRRTTHRLAALDVAVPTVMRAPGEAPGMFALESAMDELALACRLDPIELRLRNEPNADPESGLPYSTRNLPACLHEGARRFDWYRLRAVDATSRDGWLTGVGVAAATYSTYPRPGGSTARVHAVAPGRYRVDIGAADIGTGARTALTQIAAHALAVPLEAIELRIGDTALPSATPAAGAMGLNNWGSAIIAATEAFRARHGTDPVPGAHATAQDPPNPSIGRFSMHAFGAQFAQVRVCADTGEIQVPRLLGVFAVGQVINPRLARSQLVGGMTMGLSMALHEDGVVDAHLGQTVSNDLASYHIASHADAHDIQAVWIDEYDPHYNPMGAKGVGEIGIVGVAAAIANAVRHATGSGYVACPSRPTSCCASGPRNEPAATLLTTEPIPHPCEGLALV